MTDFMVTEVSSDLSRQLRNKIRSHTYEYFSSLFLLQCRPLLRNPPCVKGAKAAKPRRRFAPETPEKLRRSFSPFLL